MIFKYIAVFFFILLNLLETKGKSFSKEKKASIFELNKTAQCDNYYGLFFFDNSINGHSKLSKQLLIAEYFFELSSSSNISTSITLTSQSVYSVMNNFTVVSPSDFSTFNRQVFQVVNQNVGGKTISYLNLSKEVYNLNLLNTSIYSQNPVLVFIINSQIADLESTSTILTSLQNKNNGKIKILAIVMDSNYKSAAIQLVGGMENVFIYDENDESQLEKVNNWILQKSCSLSTLPTTTIAPQTDKYYVNIVVDATSDELTSDEYKKQLNLISNYILPLWSNFSKTSILINNGNDLIIEKHYSNTTTLSDLQTFIENSTQEKSKEFDLESVFHELVSSSYYNSIKSQMVTFIFVSHLNDEEIVKSIKDAKTLSRKGRVCFVTMGGYIYEPKLSPLNPTSFINWNYCDCEIEGIQDFFKKNLS